MAWWFLFGELRGVLLLAPKHQAALYTSEDLVLLDTIATIDLAPIFAHYERELRGQPPFHPRMMVALLLYCYATGVDGESKACPLAEKKLRLSHPLRGTLEIMRGRKFHFSSQSQWRK